MNRFESFDIPRFRELYDSLPKEFHSERLEIQLRDAYRRERERMLDYFDKAEKPEARLYLFFRHGTQWVADFEVWDRALERKEQYNFHLQNTSQWAYAGCILVDERRIKENSECLVSTHH